jgi:toxin-antitoxin system PIN domain toxin
MILIDANLLVYAYVSSFPKHETARTWLDNQLNQSVRVGLPWPSLLAFMRLVTNPRIFEKPESVTIAWKQVEAWLDCPTVWLPQPSENHRKVLAALFASQNIQGNLVPDAHLAALAIEHGLILCSTDGDFARFEGLRWENPLLTAV